MPRLPSAVPSPSRSPISRAMARRLLVMVDGAAVVPQAVVAVAQVAERSALALAVPDLAGDGQGLLVMVDGAAVVPQAGVAVAQVAERSALALAVPDLAGDGQRLLVMVDGAAVVPQAVVAEAQVAERGALALAVADLAGDGQRLLVDGRWRGGSRPGCSTQMPQVGPSWRASVARGP